MSNYIIESKWYPQWLLTYLSLANKSFTNHSQIMHCDRYHILIVKISICSHEGIKVSE